MKQTGQKGFTLIELMITVAIIGILASIAYPSYQGYVQQTKESEAKAALVSFATAMSQFYLDGMTYEKAAGSSTSPTDTGSPWIFPDKVPIDGGTKTYSLTVVSASKSKFKLKAAPVDTSFETYCIDELGTKDDCSGSNNWEIH